MKKLMVAGVVLFFSINAVATKKSLLDCDEKYSQFTVYEEDGAYKIKRQLLLSRVRGSPYVRGSLSATAEGNIEGVVSVKRTESALTFLLTDGKELSFKVTEDKEEEGSKVVISSTVPDIEAKLTEILGTNEYPLEFYESDACSVR
ncbi:MAG: hypothetical protein AB7O96_01705 [Pseudobdellovibrionaceae bacterium]